jgi:hypothetical protein
MTTLATINGRAQAQSPSQMSTLLFIGRDAEAGLS